MKLAEIRIPIVPPLRVDEGGAIRVGKCRVTLEVMLTAYKHGSSAEEIARDFDTLDLADIHAVISYYLKNRDVVDHHLAEVEAKADAMQQQAESDPKYRELVERMRRRRAERMESSK